MEKHYLFYCDENLVGLRTWDGALAEAKLRAASATDIRLESMPSASGPFAHPVITWEYDPVEHLFVRQC